ncbi:hypothetical protein LTR66_009903 [Elasticomyces elasticus]|nr:hypothetical protein LTR66_009903 [Elasticomyces elasticus]
MKITTVSTILALVATWMPSSTAEVIKPKSDASIDTPNPGGDQSVLLVDFVTSYHSNRTLMACIAAANCETYESPRGTMIRFKSGEEPGSARFQTRFANNTTKSLSVDGAPDMEGVASMNAGVHTNVDMGDRKIRYGWKDPTDVVRELWNRCGQSACDAHEFNVDTQLVVNACCGNRLQEGYALTLSAGGEYDGWPARGAFVQAVLAAAGQGQVWTKQKWHVKTRDGVNDGEVWEAEQTDYISVSRFSDDGALHGFMWVSVENPAGGRSGWCPASGAALAALAGMFNPILGGFFGFVRASCSPSK